MKPSVVKLSIISFAFDVLLQLVLLKNEILIKNEALETAKKQVMNFISDG